MFYNSLLYLCFILPGLLLPHSTRLVQKVRILEKSKLYLEGYSNVNEFTCRCEQNFGSFTTQYLPDLAAGVLSFPDTRLQIETAAIDCGHRIMNKDLKNTLQADRYPYITTQLTQVSLNVNRRQLNQHWTHLMADTRMTIAGVSRQIRIPVQARRVGATTYQFRSFYDIHLSDFGIDAPSVLMGAIRVADTFVIYFDLFVEVEQIP